MATAAEARCLATGASAPPLPPSPSGGVAPPPLAPLPPSLLEIQTTQDFQAVLQLSQRAAVILDAYATWR